MKKILLQIVSVGFCMMILLTVCVPIKAHAAAPDAPTDLGPTDLVNGSATSTTQPRLSFTLSDPDVGDSLRYEIQVDDTSNFSSPVIDYIFPGGPQGSRTFQVGQSGGSGAAYIVGNTGQTLSDASYYWRVSANDGTATSSYSVANNGNVAFVINTAPIVETVVQSSGGDALPWCSGPLAPGWNTSLPDGGCGTTIISTTTQILASSSPNLCPQYTFMRTLQFGMKGEDVRALQKLMNCLGFTLATGGAGSPGEETDLFSTRTLEAVKKFQEQYSGSVLAPIGAQKGTGIFGTYSIKQVTVLTR